MGPSGSGKSTLMHTLAGLNTVTSGHVYLNGADTSGIDHRPGRQHPGQNLVIDLTSLDDNLLTLLRHYSLGFIFQSFNLLPMFTARQNILLPLILDGAKPDREWLNLLVRTLGLEDRMNYLPSKLSGSQQQ